MIYAFTSAALNYLPKARLCLGSLRRFHPEFRLVYALADRLPEGMRLEEGCVDEVIPVEELPDIGKPSWIFQHSIVELSTGIKGAVLRHLLAREDCEAVFYFDPDIVLFSRLDDMVARLMGSNIVLTPHQAKPEATLQRIIDNEICSLRYGIFNLGFIGVRNTPVGMQFSNWWANRLEHFCFDQPERGLFTDQKWINHVPVFFDGTDIVTDPRFNVATWNITTRTMHESPSADVLIDGEPLGFYHFTGFDSGAHAVMANRNGAGNETLQRLIEWYRSSIAVAEHDSLAKLPWRFGSYADGTPIKASHRRLYARRHDLQSRFPDPFAAASSSAETYLGWIHGSNSAEATALRDDAMDELQVLRAENAKLKYDIRQMKASSSWRITKLLRAFEQKRSRQS